MKDQISVREAITAEETARFWRELGAYHDRDIFANAESEEREYFHGSEYREAVQAADRLYHRRRKFTSARDIIRVYTKRKLWYDLIS